MGLNEKYVMIHADDAGLSHSQNQATMACLKQGVVNSYSIMVPCPGFEEMATFAKQHPTYDYGIHLTLTCEWRDYKFGPVLPVDEVPSLVDENGYFHKTRKEVKTHAHAEEVYKELKAQINRAVLFGLHPTHLDSHMYSVGAAMEFFQVYKQLGKEYGLPVLINRKLLEMTGLNVNANIISSDFEVEHAHFATFNDFEKAHLRTFYMDVLDKITPGLHIILIHPAFDDQEMKQITVDHPNFGSEWRQMDFDTFTAMETRHKLEENGIKLITWKEISKRFMG